MFKTITKKKNLRKAISLFLVVIMLAMMQPFAPIAAHAEENYTASGTSISNEYLKFAFNGNNNFALYTVEGDPESPTDNDVRLLFGDITAGTSDTILNINGASYVFNSNNCMISNDGNSLYATYTVNDVLVEQLITLSYNTVTQRNDTVEFKYVFTNLGTESATAGARIFFDTMLAGNDSAPFKIPGVGDLTREAEYTGDDIPQTWQVFDSLTNPTVVASGTFYNDISNRPDRVQFMLYGNGTYNTYDCSISNSSFGDSAVSVYYDPIELGVGESRTISTYYGMSTFVPPDPIDPDPTVELGIEAIVPQELLVNPDTNTYSGNPITFNSWVSNAGNTTADNVSARINLPEGLSVVGQSNTVSLASVAPSDYKNLTWYITADNFYEETELNYSVDILMDGEIVKTYNYTLLVHALELVHTHTFIESSRTNATCTTDGRINYACSCGETNIGIIQALGHNIETTIETMVTCTSDGLIIDHCVSDGCDYEKRTVIHGSHNYAITNRQDATCDTPGYIEYTCANCGEKYYEYFDGMHNYVESSRDEPQVEIEGSVTYTCTSCGDSYYIVIPALLPVLKNSAVLLIQDSLPWAENVNTTLLELLQDRGVVSYYNIINTNALSSFDLSQYGVVFIANDQSTAMYNRLAANAEKLENYVRAGGNLIYGACDEGWGGCGSLTHALPGGVTTSNYYSVHNYIVNELHPIVTGVYTDNKSLRDELLKGNYCSHTYFDTANLLEGTNIILRDANGNPTLIEYNLGEGTVIASGLTWEYFYVRNHYSMSTNYSKYVFDDLLTYMVYMSNTCEHNYERLETVEATCEENGYTRYVCSICSYEYMGDVVLALGHTYVETSRTDASCISTGEIVYTCACGTVMTELIDYTDHIESEWIVVTEPTAITYGHKHTICTVCGEEVRSELIPVLALIDVADIETRAGSIVTVTIDIQNNPGILGAVLKLTYDPSLTLIDAVSGSAWSSLNLTKPGELLNNCNFVWDGINDPDDSNGTIITLTFEVPSDATVGTVYRIGVSYEDGNIVNENNESITIEVSDGSIMINQLKGDVNDDGIVDVADVVTLRRYIAGGYGVSINRLQSDMNNDGEVNISDIIELRRYIVNH